MQRFNLWMLMESMTYPWPPYKKTWDGPQMPTETFYILQICLLLLSFPNYKYLYTLSTITIVIHGQSSLTINNLYRNGQIKEYPLQNGLVRTIPAKDPIELNIVPIHIQTNPTIMYTNSSHQYSSVINTCTNHNKYANKYMNSIPIFTTQNQFAGCIILLYLAVVCYILFVLKPLQNDQAHPLPKYNSGGGPL